MSINLYQEAIIEARQLREMAETNAKNKIIEAVTPKIRRLIEQQLADKELEDDSLVVGDEEFEAEVPAPAPGPSWPTRDPFWPTRDFSWPREDSSRPTRDFLGQTYSCWSFRIDGPEI